MQSRRDKERQLKKNVEINTARSIKVRQEELRRELTLAEKDYYRDAFEQSANQIDASDKLPHLWNDKEGAAQPAQRSGFGYFGGVNFDKNGKIIR